MTDEAIHQSGRSNTTLWILILIFAIPIISAYGYFFFADDYSLGNHGDLLTPVIQIETLELTDRNGETLTRDELIHTWKMLYVADASCSADCGQTLYYMRQINAALGKNSSRFEHMIIHLSAMSGEFEQLVRREHEAALHAYGRAEKLASSLGIAESQLTSDAIYIMDPLGNIMMRFDAGTPPKLILKDLNRLLKISRIG